MIQLCRYRYVHIFHVIEGVDSQKRTSDSNEDRRDPATVLAFVAMPKKSYYILSRLNNFDKSAKCKTDAYNTIYRLRVNNCQPVVYTAFWRNGQARDLAALFHQASYRKYFTSEKTQSPDLLTVHGGSFMHTHLVSMAARPLGQHENTAAIVFFLRICFEN